MGSGAVRMRRRVTIALAVVPAAAAAIIPIALVAVSASEILALVGVRASVADALWVLVLLVSLGVLSLKFLLPWEALVRRHGHPVKASLALWAVWLLSLLISVLVAFLAARPLIPTNTPLHVLALWGAVWLCVELMGTLALPALSLPRTEVHSAAEPDGGLSSATARQEPMSGRPLSASPADELYAWLVSLFSVPTEKLPEGIDIDHDLRCVITSQRMLARARHQPRSNVVRLLNQLERRGRLDVNTTHRDTWIHFPLPGAPKSVPMRRE